jgi:hypothetical protein
MLVAAGRGPARIHTCEQTLVHAHTEVYHAASGLRRCFDAVVARALSFFGPDELRALRVDDARLFRLVLSTIEARSHDNAATSQLAQALNSLRAVEVVSCPLIDNDRYAVALIKRCAATIRELKGDLPARLLCESEGSESDPPVLARCTRLEVLTWAFCYTPAVWLGLSQLHTLHDVDLSKVPTGAIAAALPRLHTLTTYGECFGSGRVAGFFTDLLPRLRVFHFQGEWPLEADEPIEAEGAAVFSAPPLPLLKELKWRAEPQPALVFRQFLGARPAVLRALCGGIIECLSARFCGASDCPANGLLTRVCELEVFGGNVADVARILRAAPRLRTFSMHAKLRGDMSWLTASAAPLHPAFVGLVHPKMRYFSLTNVYLTAPCDDVDEYDIGCASRLRTCFPRLHTMHVNYKTFFAG